MEMINANSELLRLHHLAQAIDGNEFQQLIFLVGPHAQQVSYIWLVESFRHSWPRYIMPFVIDKTIAKSALYVCCFLAMGHDVMRLAQIVNLAIPIGFAETP